MSGNIRANFVDVNLGFSPLDRLFTLQKLGMLCCSFVFDYSLNQADFINTLSMSTENISLSQCMIVGGGKIRITFKLECCAVCSCGF